VTLVLGEDESVVFFAKSPEELKGHHKEDDPDAGTGEHGGGLDLP